MSQRDDEPDEERDVLQSVQRLVTLAELVTVRQAVDAGHEACDAAGLNPWCMNEGTATGNERVYLWWTDELLEAIRELIQTAEVVRIPGGGRPSEQL